MKEQKPAAKPDTARAFNDEFKRGYDLLVAKRWDEGIAAMQRCLELAPQSPLCAYNLACAYAQQAQPEPAIEWFEKCVAWGFGYDAFQDMIAGADKDTDLDPLRADPRFVAALDKARAHERAVQEYVGKAAVYVPASLEGTASMPVLVVLHPSGATKDSVITGRWKAIADELGTALVAPSARLLVAREPEKGMAWYQNIADLANARLEPALEKSVRAALAAFKKTHAVDAARVLLAGEGEGGLVALRMACADPRTFKGVVALESGLAPQLLADKAPAAAKAGLKVRILLDRRAFAERLAADPAQTLAADAAIARWNEDLVRLGFPGALEVYASEPDATGPPASDDVKRRLIGSLRAMQPAAVEAGAPK